jgi:hypothetical protein
MAIFNSYVTNYQRVSIRRGVDKRNMILALDMIIKYYEYLSINSIDVKRALVIHMESMAHLEMIHHDLPIKQGDFL